MLSVVPSVPSSQGARDCPGWPALPGTFGCWSFWLKFLWLGGVPRGSGQTPARGSIAAACPRVGRLTGSRDTSPEHLLRDGSDLPTRFTQEQGALFGSRLLCPASLAWGDLTTGSQSGWRGRNHQFVPLPTCKGIRTGRVAGQVGGGGTWCLLSSDTMGGQIAQQPRLLILARCEQPNWQRGNKREFWYLGKTLRDLQNLPSPRAKLFPRARR